MSDLLEETKEEQKKLHRSLSNALSQIRQAEKSSYWSYTREFALGQLTAARTILAAVVKDLKPIA